VTQSAAFQPRSAKAEGSSAEPPSTAAEHSLFAPELEWLASLGEQEYREIFRGSAIKRAKWRGLVRNACVALGNSRADTAAPAGRRIVELLERLAAREDAVIAEHARWALARLRSPQAGQPGSG